MDESVKRSSLDVFSKAYYTAKLLAIAAPFERKNQRGSIFSKIYDLFHLIIIIALQAHCFSRYLDRHEDLEGGFYYTSNVIRASREIVSFLQYLVTILGTAFWNRKKWTEFYRRFSHTEPVLQKGLESFYIKHFDSIFLFNNFIYLCLSALDIAMMVVMTSVDDYTSNFLIFYYMLCENVKMALIYAYLYGINNKFCNLKGLLKERYTKNTDTPLNRVGNLFRQLCELVNVFNSLFGFQMFLCMVQSCIMSLETLNLIWKYFSEKYKITENPIPTSFMLVNLTMIFINVLRPVMAILGCDKVTKSAQKITNICYKYQEKFSIFSQEKQELLNLASQTINRKPSFTAAGFFDINRTTMFALFGTAVAYFIIMIQFNYSL